MPDVLIRRRWLLAAVLGITALAVAGALFLSAGDSPEASAGPATDVAQAREPSAGVPASEAEKPERSAGSPVRPEGESADETALASDDGATKASDDRPATVPDEGANTDARRLIDDRGRAEPKVVEEEPQISEDHPGGRGDLLSPQTIEESSELEAANSPHHATGRAAIEESKEIESHQDHDD
jgi:hypothetical protein